MVNTYMHLLFERKDIVTIMLVDLDLEFLCADIVWG